MKEVIGLDNWTPWRFIRHNCVNCNSSMCQIREYDLIKDSLDNRVLLRICSDCVKDNVIGIEKEYKCVRCGYIETKREHR